MVWKHGDDYTEQTNAELEHLLRLRGLPYSGKKEKKVSRLVAHDGNHPFPFLGLPGELKNMIYKLVSSSTDRFYCAGPKLPIQGHTEGIYCNASLQDISVHTSLFRACRQIHREGPVFFYQLHHLVLFVEHSGCFLAILRWLHNIGDFGRQNIRHLCIHYMNECYGEDLLFMDNIHEMLSEQATVIYVPEDPESLWRLGRLFSRIIGRAPAFRIGGTDPGYPPFKIEHTDYTHRLNWRHLRPRLSRLTFALVFYPGRSWFGPRVDV